MSSRHLEIPRVQVDSALQRFEGQRVVVVGDVMLDRYLWGTVRRISPEAPVPIVEVHRETVRLGGAANVAGNVRALGGEAVLIGLSGDDATAAQLRAALAERQISGDHLVSDRSRRTTQKTRIIAHHQQVVRADEEDAKPVSVALASALESQVAQA